VGWHDKVTLAPRVGLCKIQQPKPVWMSVVVLVFGPAEATSECLQLEDERTYLWRDLTSDFDPIGDHA